MMYDAFECRAGQLNLQRSTRALQAAWQFRVSNRKPRVHILGCIDK
jgi:hypothetical protein